MNHSPLKTNKYKIRLEDKVCSVLYFRKYAPLWRGGGVNITDAICREKEKTEEKKGENVEDKEMKRKDKGMKQKDKGKIQVKWVK